MPDQTQPDAGVAEGTVLEVTVHGEPGEKVQVRREVVVYEEDGTWHKEVVD
jgi:hypothetical protein